MEPINGVKIYKIGDCDWAYGRTQEEAVEVMNEMCGKEWVEEVTEDNPVSELTQEQFDKGKIYHDVEGKLCEYDAPLISYKEALEDVTKDGSTSGHFATTEM